MVTSNGVNVGTDGMNVGLLEDDGVNVGTDDGMNVGLLEDDG